MKVLSIEPGRPMAIGAGTGWGFTVIINGRAQTYESSPYHTQSAARQAMREEVAHLRKKHCLPKGNET